MSDLFLKIVNMSISASWLVLAVLLLRLVLKRAPKWVNVLLWAIVAVRLICPFSIESALSLIPSAETISPGIMMDQMPTIQTGVPAINSVVNPVIGESFAPAPGASANPLQIWIPILSIIWAVGVAALLLYTAASYWRLRQKVSEAVILRDNIYQSENVSSPFVLGVIKPKVYLPYHMDGQDLNHVVAHEKAHIRRRDHWWKPLGFLLLTIHWFNPLMWLAYVLLCRDIELACDEKVIRELGNEQRADYTQALVACSVNRRMIAACPLAFGEIGVKERVKSVMNYKKPTFWVIVLAVITCVVVAVCFLTNPAAEREFPISGSNVSELDTAHVLEMIAKAEKLEDGSQLCVNADNFDLMFTSDFNWANDGAIRFFYLKNQKTYSAQLRMFHDENKYFITDSDEWIEQEQIFKLFHYLDALKYMPQEELCQLSPDADGYSVFMRHEGAPSDYERVLKYGQDGIKDSGGWNIHLEVQPLHRVEGGGYNGSGDEVVHLFYEDTSIAATENASRDLLSTDKIVMAYYGGHGESPIERTITNSADISNLLSMYQSLEVKEYSRPLSEVRLVLQFYSGDEKTLDWKVSYYEEDDTVVTSSDGFGLGNRLVINDFSYDELMAFYQCGSVTMIPTATKLLGSQAGAILVPINGETFRYLLTDKSNQYQSTDQLLYTFAEETGAEDIIWEVYALKEYPDLSVVLMVSETNGSWLCRYSPPGRCVDSALTEAVDAGYVILEDGVATHGQNRWKEFYTRTQSGKNATVSVAHYFTLDPERCDPAYYEVFNQDYPYMSIYHLSYDGNVFTLSFTDGGVQYNKTYEYLMIYDATRFSPISATQPKETTRYVLTHSNTVTWEQLFNGMVSSQFGAYIDHHSIYTEQNSQ